MPDEKGRTIDHVVHAVDDLDDAAAGYRDLGFTVTPRADHPFGTSNRLVVLDDAYVEIVSVTDPSRLPEGGFAARVTSHLRERGEGISHLVFSSVDPPAEIAELGELATGEVFSFSRPAPQIDGSIIEASFECALATGTDDLGMFLCRHVAPEAVWNEHNKSHANRGHHIEALTLPVDPSTLVVLGMLAGVVVTKGTLTLGKTLVTSGKAAIRIDTTVPSIEIGCVSVGGHADQRTTTISTP